MARVFVSYTHQEPDKDIAQEVAGALRENHEVFIDTSIPGGRTWGDLIDRELQTADFLIPLLSARSLASPMVVAEISAAHQLNVGQGRPAIIPVRLDSSQLRYPMTAYVGRFQEISWDGPGDTERLKKEAIRAVELKPILFFQSPERQQMIQRVRVDWIEGILQTSLRGANPVGLELQSQPRAIDHPLDAVIQRPDEDPSPLPAGTRLISVFNQHLGQLLILGAPGSGKTTLLLQLASELLDIAETNPNEPIPVVFNLSSWADQRKPIEDWLIEELRLRSDVPPDLARKWVRENQLLLLLDGLDEVAGVHREACVEAINEYRVNHGRVKIAVCSRVSEYQALTTRLRLPAAILILPLSKSRVLEYLDDTPGPLEGLREAVRVDPNLWALLETPLTLSIVAVVGGHLKALNPAEGSGTALEQRREELFAYYVDAMFRRRTKETRYSPLQMRKWLIWLAKAMVRREQTFFRLEDLRHHWLESRVERFFVLAAAAVFVALVSGVVGSSVLAQAFLISYGHGKNEDVFFSLMQALLPYFGVAGLLLALARGGKREPVDLVSVRWPGSLKLLAGIAEGGVFGAVLGFVFGWVGCSLQGDPGDHMGEIVAGARMYAAFGIVAFGLGRGMDILARSREVEIRPSPNYAISQSLRNTSAYIGISLLFGGLGILIMALRPATNSDQPITRIDLLCAGGLALLGWVGFFFGMEKGGYFLLNHYATRLLLWKKGVIPWNYLRFLDAAADRVLMIKAGASYRFLHRMLQDYFAASPEA